MSTLGRYEVLGELGTGSMGTIYRGRDAVLDRDVALKTIARAGSLDPELKERFYREARLCAKLNHPNIVTIYDLGEQDGTAFIAMELLTGGDLKKFIAEKQTLPNERKVQMFADLCDGLHHAHSHGIIHRDLKPSNIFLNSDGVAKILDFGIARLPASSLTMMGRVLGTPHYMAPEQIMGQPCDARSDVFALAMVAFEFLTYAHPFFGESIPKRIMHDNPDSLRERNPQLPAQLEQVIARALAKDPAQRYPSAADFGRALRTSLKDFGTTPETAAPQAPPPVEVRSPQFANTEVKMEAIIGALNEFDAAIEAKNVTAARTALSVIGNVARADSQYQTAFQQSTERLRELEASLPAPAPVTVAPPPPQPAILKPVEPPPVVAAPPPPPPKPVTPPPPVIAPPVVAPPVIAPPVVAPVVTPPPPPPVTQQTAPLEDTAAFGSGDATSLFGTAPVAPPPPPKPVQAAAPRPPEPVVVPQTTTPSPALSDSTASIPPIAFPPAVPPPPPAQPAQQAIVVQPKVPPAPQHAAAAKSTKIIFAVIGVAALFFIGIAGFAGYWFFLKSKPVPRMPAVATARVVAAQSRIVDSPSASASEITTVKKDDTVNVISAPHSKDQEWTAVQYIAGNKVFAAGAMKTADLGGWASAKPDVALFLLQTFGAADAADEAGLRAYVDKLSAFISQYPGTPQETEARAELDKVNARLSAAAASAAAAAGQVSDPAQGSAAANQQSNTAAAQANGQTPQNGQNPPPGPPPTPEALVKRAAALWEQGEYGKAERQLKWALALKPDFQPAKDLLVKVEKAIQLEGRR